MPPSGPLQTKSEGRSVGNRTISEGVRIPSFCDQFMNRVVRIGLLLRVHFSDLGWICFEGLNVDISKQQRLGVSCLSYAFPSLVGRFLAARPSITRDHPLQSMSIPTNTPITQQTRQRPLLPDGNAQQEVDYAVQQQPNPVMEANADRCGNAKMPPKIRNMEMSSVNVTAVAPGFAMIMKPTTV